MRSWTLFSVKWVINIVKVPSVSLWAKFDDKPYQIEQIVELYNSSSNSSTSEKNILKDRYQIRSSHGLLVTYMRY